MTAGLRTAAALGVLVLTCLALWAATLAALRGIWQVLLLLIGAATS